MLSRQKNDKASYAHRAGLKPFEQVPFQVSIHTMQTDGALTHFEYLDNELEKVFHSDYIYYHFTGSSSIKKVLPVLVPELSYKNLNVLDCTMAMDTWGKVAFNEISSLEKEQIRKDLLAYCKLNTLAIVEIYKYLKGLLQV